MGVGTEGCSGTHHSGLKSDSGHSVGDSSSHQKGDNKRIYGHSHNESQLSVTILNLVRERMRGSISSGQAGRFNTTFPQHNHKMSPLRWWPLCGQGTVPPGLGRAELPLREEGGRLNNTRGTAKRPSISPKVQGGSGCCQPAAAQGRMH